MFPSLRFRSRSLPLALLCLGLLSFGLLAARLGFYWDDWSSIWFYHQLGPAGVAEMYSVDRPALGWLFYLTTSLLGDSPVAWQFFGILTRWVCCLAVWWFLNSLWPGKPTQAAWITLLFAVYPGFKQQHIAVTYSHDWIILAGFFVSLSFSIWALRRPRWFWPLMVASWLLAAYALFADEYYFGLELLRPLFIWMVLRETEVDNRRRIRRTLLYWLPYLAIVLAFLVWRIFIHISPRGQVGVFALLQDNPLAGLLALFKTVVLDVLETGLGAWAASFKPPDFDFLGSVFTTLYFVVIVVGAALTWFYLSRLRPEGQAADQPGDWMRWSYQALLVGGLALLVGGIPFWMTDLPITLDYPWDRFTLPMMFGASLLIVGLLELIHGRMRLKIAVISVLVGLAVGLHLQNAYHYRQEWLWQKAYFWQLAWRVPDLRPGTAILTGDWPFDYYSDFTMTAPLNWLYDPQNRTREMSYLLYTVESRLGAGLPEFARDLPLEQDYRTLHFSGSTSQSLAVFYNPPGCLRVGDPLTDMNMPKQPLYFRKLVRMTDLSLIDTSPESPVVPQADIFGPEPEPDWCYYYQKADLAQQQGDWAQVARLGDQAERFTGGLKRLNAAEYFPYIEGYAYTRQWDKALDYSQRVLKLLPSAKFAVCEVWDRIQANPIRADGSDDKISAIKKEVGCTQP